MLRLQPGMRFENPERLEDFAVKRFPKRGKCKHSPFMNGHHRVGLIPFLSSLDGGLPGDSSAYVCLHCGYVFKDFWFIPKDQPAKLTIP